MTVTEHTLTHMLRNSGEVIAEVAHRDVVLSRRDGDDLFLGLRSREDSLREALGVLARVLVAASADERSRRKVAMALASSLPWTTFLPANEREDFLSDLTTTAAACAELDTFEPLARIIDGWRAAAELHANPDIAELVGRKHRGPAVSLARPEAS